MLLMTGQSKFRDRLRGEAKARGLGYVNYAFLPSRGIEGLFVESGHPCDGPRQVQAVATASGRAELQWTGSLSFEQAGALLQDLESHRRGEAPPLSERLHATICQSLTAAHLHLELGLMSHPEAGEVFHLAQGLVHEATTSVRDLIDELAGEEP